MSASTRGADGSGFSLSRPPKSLVIESTATCGSTVESGITATCRASRCICSIVARIVACWAGRANATRCPVTGSIASLTDRVAFQQRLQHLQHRLRIGRRDRIDLELRRTGDAAGRVGHVDQPQHFLDAGDAFRRAVHQQLPAGDVLADVQLAVRRAERLVRNAEQLPQIRHRIVDRQMLERDFTDAAGVVGRPLDGVDHRANRPQPAAGFGDLNLLRLRQHDDRALRSQAAARLPWPPRRPSCSSTGNVTRIISYSPCSSSSASGTSETRFGGMPSSRFTSTSIRPLRTSVKPLVSSTLLMHVERFGRRVGARVAVVERARRRRFEHQRQVGLLGEPIEHVLPRLVAEVEHAARRRPTRLAWPVRSNRLPRRASTDDSGLIRQRGRAESERGPATADGQTCERIRNRRKGNMGACSKRSRTRRVPAATPPEIGAKTVSPP